MNERQNVIQYVPVLSVRCLLVIKALGIVAILLLALCCHNNRSIFQQKRNGKKNEWIIERNEAGKPEGLFNMTWFNIVRLNESLVTICWVLVENQKNHIVLCFVFCIEHYMWLLCQNKGQKKTSSKILKFTTGNMNNLNVMAECV